MKFTPSSTAKLLLNLTLAALSATVMLPASAALILTTGDTYSFHENLKGRNVLSIVKVGSSDVAIGRFATKGMLQSDGNIEFVIFNGSNAGLSPAYKSEILAEKSSADVWWNSPLFNFTLLANNTYQFGLISDQFFAYDWNLGGDVNMNGLTAYGSQNGNANGDLVSPMTTGNGGVQQSIEIFSPNAVPEPTTVALLGLGLLGFAASRRKSAK